LTFRPVSITMRARSEHAQLNRVQVHMTIIGLAALKIYVMYYMYIQSDSPSFLTPDFKFIINLIKFLFLKCLQVYLRININVQIIRFFQNEPLFETLFSGKLLIRRFF